MWLLSLAVAGVGPSIKRPRVPPAQLPKGPGSAQGPPGLRSEAGSTTPRAPGAPPDASPAIHLQPNAPSREDLFPPRPLAFPSLEVPSVEAGPFPAARSPESTGWTGACRGGGPARTAMSVCGRAGRILGEMCSLVGHHVLYRETVDSLDSSGMSPRANQNPSVLRRSATKGQGFRSHRGQERSPAPTKHPSLPSFRLARVSCLEKSLPPWGHVRIRMYVCIRHALPLPGATTQSVRELLDGVLAASFFGLDGWMSEV